MLQCATSLWSADLTNLAKVRMFHRDREPTVGFTLLRVPHRSDGQVDWNVPD